MRRAVPIALLAPLWASCSQPTSGYCGSSADCPPERPVCDVDGAAGIANSCIVGPADAAPEPAPVPDAAPDALVPECMPDSVECVLDQRIVCDARGLIEAVEPCAMGCAGDEPRCLDVLPSNQLAAVFEDIPTAPDLVLADGTTIDTTTRAIVSAGQARFPPTVTVAQDTGPEILVIRAGRLSMGDVSVTGAAAVAFVADGRVTIGGRLRVRSGAAQSCGPTAGELVRRGGTCRASGAGGGGFGAPGGAGGSAGDVAGGIGGPARGTELLEPLLGGCDGAGDFTRGKAGGAVQIVSRQRIELLPGARIDASGRGGSESLQASFCQDGSTIGPTSGGGSGGGILLEAPVVLLPTGSVLDANGGGGACRSGSAASGGPGPAPAAGGDCEAAHLGAGGQGGAAAGAAGDGESLGIDLDKAVGGAGGGAIGRIRINTRDGSLASGAPLVSPTPSMGVLQAR